MNKLIIFVALVACIALVQAQPDPRTDINGKKYTSTIPNWTCTFNFNKAGASQYTETLTSKDADKSNGNMNPFKSDHLDTISWKGTSCYCWVIVFEDARYDEASFGFWVQSTSGSIDLTNYVYLKDKDLITRDDYVQWNKDVSSYHIYCH